MSGRQRVFFIGVLAGLTAVRIAMAAALPLADDEAYYWTWSRHLAWGYPDHPPLIAGVIHLTTALVGDTPLGVRLGAILFALGTSVILFDLGRQMYGPRIGIVAVLVLQLIPIFALGAGFAAPDGPLGFFWVLTVWFVWRAVRDGRARDWIGAGVALGLAVMSKLPALILGLSMGGFLFSTPVGRKSWGRPGPYVMALAFMITAFPAAWWIATHWELVILRAHQSQPWLKFNNPGLNVVAFFAGQSLYYGPITFLLLLAALRETLYRDRATTPGGALLGWSAIPLLLITSVGSLSGLPKPHWLAPAYIIAVVPAVAAWMYADRWRARRHFILLALGMNTLLITAGFVALFWSSSPAAVAVRGWREVATKLTTLIEQTPSSPGVFILTTEYQTASQLAFHLKERYPITTVYQDTAFAARTNSRMLAGWNAVFVHNLAGGATISIQPLFKRVEPLPPIEVRINGQVIQHLLVSRGYEFRGILTSGQQPTIEARHLADPVPNRKR